MRRLIAIFVLVLGVWIVTRLPPHVLAYVLGGQLGQILVALLFLIPVIGFFSMILMFHRWHRGFHARMKRDGLWGRPR